MNTSLKFVAPPDFSVGRVRISNESGVVHEWVATPENLEMPAQPASPGYYTADIAPAGVTPQSVIFQVRPGQANNVTLPSFSALSANGSAPNFFGVDDENAALRSIFRSSPRRDAAALSSARPVAVDASRRRITVGISQERPLARDGFGPFTGTYSYDLVGDRLSIEVGPGEGWDAWEGRRVRLSTAIQGVRLERQLLPMYGGGTTIGISPSPLSPADIEHQVLPAEPRLRALIRALQGGTPDEAAQLHKDLLAPGNLRDLLDRRRGDPWGAILAGLLFFRFPDVLGVLSSEWTAELADKAAWAYDSHVIRARQVLSSASTDAGAQAGAARVAVGHLARAQTCGSPYYSYTNQLFGEMAEGLAAFLGDDDTAVSTAGKVLARWRRDAPLQRGNGATFSWLSRDQKALKLRRLAPQRSASGQLRARDTTVILTGTVERGRVTIGGSAKLGRDQRAEASAASSPVGSPRPRRAGADAGFMTLVRSAQPPRRRAPPQQPASPRADDPNLGRFGGLAEAGGFRLNASFKQAGRDWATIKLTVEAAKSASVEVGDLAVFHLHPTFPQPEIRVMFNERHATLSFQAWGGFTVGVRLPRQEVMLELDLSKLSDAPTIIRTR